MTPDRVIHISRGRDWRGGERQVCLLAGSLRAVGGITQTVVTGRDCHVARALEGSGIDLALPEWRLAWDPRALGSLLRVARSPTLDPVLHAHDSHALALGLAVAALTGRPLVATRRSTTPPSRLWRLPAQVIAISGAVEDALIGAGVTPQRITRIPSGVDLPCLDAMRAAARPCTIPLIVTAGALTVEKGHATLLRAFARLATGAEAPELLLLGDGPERRALVRLAARLGIASRTEFRGAVADPFPVLASATVVVQPSLREALGTAALEAMALGRPVVASAVGGLPELLGADAGLLVPPGDAEALAAALATLLADGQRRRTLGEAARRRASAFDAAGMAARVVRVYRSALTRTGT